MLCRLRVPEGEVGLSAMQGERSGMIRTRAGAKYADLPLGSVLGLIIVLPTVLNFHPLVRRPQSPGTREEHFVTRLTAQGNACQVIDRVGASMKSLTPYPACFNIFTSE